MGIDPHQPTTGVKSKPSFKYPPGSAPGASTGGGPAREAEKEEAQGFPQGEGASIPGPEPKTRARRGKTPVDLAIEDPSDFPSPETPRKRKARTKVDRADAIGAIETLLLGTHEALAFILQAEHWRLTKDEGHALAEAIDRIQQHYGWYLVGESAGPWIQLLAVTGKVYGPRVIVSMMSGHTNTSHPTPVNRHPTPAPQAASQGEKGTVQYP